MISLPPLRPATGGCCDRFFTSAALMSATVMTATTPLIASAGLVSIDLTVGEGMRRADEAGIGLAGQRGVGHVAARAAQQVVVLDADGRACGKSVCVHVG